MDTQPSTHYHSLPVKQFNREHSDGSKIDLSEETLIAEARTETGLERFGDESFLPAMRTLLDAVEKEADLNPFGRFNAKTRTLRSLDNRLWANACFEAHPEIRRREIVAPVIVVGLHRSGTTRLQRMMATDARLQYLKTWEGINPAPRLGLADMGKATRREEVRQFLHQGPLVYPGAFTAHPIDTDWPEEELLLLNHSFGGFSPLGLYHVPSYYRWFLADDKHAAYRYMAELMKLISWSRDEPQGLPDRRWLLKNPQHMLDLPTLMQMFPDAKLVFMHRDPIKTVGSVMSLMWCYAVQHTDLPCRASIRETWLDFYEQMARRSIAAREHIPAAQQLDVHYADMNRDWRAEMRRVYDFAGLEFSADTENAMAAWLAESEREGLHGGHHYALEDFGTTTDEVDARMKFYRERYGIPYEAK
ncbi:MAG: sulfotransferase [Sulfuricellaceae bacterium]